MSALRYRPASPLTPLYIDERGIHKRPPLKLAFEIADDFTQTEAQIERAGLDVPENFVWCSRCNRVGHEGNAKCVTPARNTSDGVPVYVGVCCLPRED